MSEHALDRTGTGWVSWGVALAAMLMLLVEPLARTEFRGGGPEDGVAALGTPVPTGPEPVTWDIPIHRTPEVEYWIDFYTGPGHDFFEVWLERMGGYEKLIRSQLRQRGLPEDLVFIALIESGFEPLAISPARALGMWQFMAPTAREHGLLVNAYVDERIDPIKSTVAAVDFLESLHDRFGSWYLAVAAYNAGPGRVGRALARHAADQAPSEELFWKIAPDLPRETRQHVPRLIAAAILGKEPGRFGFEPREHEPMTFETMYAPGRTPLARIARGAGVSEERIRDLNPHLIRDITPPGLLYPVRIPEGTAPDVVASLARPDGPGAPRAALAEE